MNFLNGSIHRHQPQTESETAALAAPLSGFEYVGSNRVGSDLTRVDHAVLESRWIDPETARRAGIRRVDSLTGGEIVGRRGAGYYAAIIRTWNTMPPAVSRPSGNTSPLRADPICSISRPASDNRISAIRSCQ